MVEDIIMVGIIEVDIITIVVTDIVGDTIIITDIDTITDADIALK